MYSQDVHVGQLTRTSHDEFSAGKSDVWPQRGSAARQNKDSRYCPSKP